MFYELHFPGVSFDDLKPLITKSGLIFKSLLKLCQITADPSNLN